MLSHNFQETGIKVRRQLKLGHYERFVMKNLEEEILRGYLHTLFNPCFLQKLFLLTVYRKFACR